MELLANSITRWNPAAYHVQQTIQVSLSNHGQVLRVERGTDGKMLAVKRIPSRWMRSCHQSFLQKYPMALEQPWKDAAIVKLLNDLKFPYACQLHGLFRDDVHMYLATTLVPDGDLCTLCYKNGPRPCLARERWIAPLVIQSCSAVRYLHDLNVVHLDISLENILVDHSLDEPRIKLIDFGMAQVTRFC